MISYAKTDTGLVRRSNQDFLFAADQPVGPLPESVHRGRRNGRT